MDFIADLPLDPPLQVSIEPYVDPRSLDQNSLMHVLWDRLGKELGYGGDEVKEVMKDKYGPKLTVTLRNETKVVPKPSRKYTKAESSAMIDQIYRLGAQMGVQL